MSLILNSSFHSGVNLKPLSYAAA